MHARRQSRSARKMATSLKLMSEKAIAVALFSDASILAAAAHRQRAPMRDLAMRAGSVARKVRASLAGFANAIGVA